MMGDVAADRGEPLLYVIRSVDTWLLAPVPGDEPTVISLGQVLATLETADPIELAAHDWSRHRPPAGSVGADLLVQPAPVFAGLATPEGLLVEDPAGSLMLLDPDDLALVDRIAGPTPVVDLIAPGGDGPPEVVDRVARLLSTGHLRAGDGFDPPAESAGEEPVPESEPVTPPVASRAATRSVAPRVRRAVSALVRRASSAGDLAPGAGDAVPAPGPDHRIPVYAPWSEDVGPLLALGMLTATARHWQDGALTATYEIRRPETYESMLSDLGRRTGPAVILCSDYVWSVAANLDVARRALELCPDLLVVHGGPSSPQYDEDRARFFADHGDVAHILVKGEGEEVLCELLEKLAQHLPARPAEVLESIDGISFVEPDSGVVRSTPDRDRIEDLDALPSPYLTGEFDHIPGPAWVYVLSIETTRGCPYGCTFCDWGSATMSRIRKFSLERVAAELRWAAERGVFAVQITDANFGILERDVTTAGLIVDALATVERGFILSWSPAKNTTRHLTRIMDTLIGGGVKINSALSLQTTDAGVLAALDRSNISNDHFVELAADYRRRGYPLQGDLLLGLPEQTFDTYKRDLQFFLDLEISPRTWPVQVLPNAPMNAPEYRERYGLVIDGDNLVRSTSTFDEAARARMLRLRNVFIITERLGLLRHVMRYLQWDLGIPALDVMEHVLGVIERAPQRFPVLSWTLSYFDLHPTVAVGWTAFYDEVKSLVVEDLGVPADSTALECVLGLQRFLMPWAGREFPESIDLEHDYVSYYRSATASLYTTGHAGLPDRPLAEYGPAVFTVEADPLGLCDHGLHTAGGFGDSRNEVFQGDFHVGGGVANELISPLVRILPVMGGLIGPPVELETAATADPASTPAAVEGAVPVSIGSRRPPA